MEPKTGSGDERGNRLQRALKDGLAGAIFIAFGAAFVGIALTYELGTPVQMGPGYFPVVLGGILVVLGLMTVGKGFLTTDDATIGSVPWRGIALVVGSILFFGITVRGLGLIPATFLTGVLAALGSERTGPVRALIIAAALTVASVLIFVVALRLRLTLIGPWIPT